MKLEDAWYLVEELDPGTFAIGEPRYRQQNWSYLVAGTERSLLFDTGSYYGDISGVVGRRAKGPLTALPSHMHYDHLGNVTRFDRIALPDLAVLRACADGGRVTPSATLFLGRSENRIPPSFDVAEWLEPDGWIDLGGRQLQMLHTPGHSPDSVSLWEPERDRLLAADYLYRGELYAQVPGASLADYLATARRLAGIIGPGTAIYGAHADAPTAPLLGKPDLEALIRRLEALEADPVRPAAGETRTVEVAPGLWLIIGADA
jgi:glyoxylase-like metal-dependent hydrolase (beta-lactamase superfamily II)